MKLYLDTSIYGGYYDDEFKEDTRLLFDCIDSNDLMVIVSEVVQLELSRARKEVRDTIKMIKNLIFEDITDEMETLAENYLKSKALPKKCIEDARHVAFATIIGGTNIVSWNFKHLVNFQRIDDLNVVNLREGYRTINIYTPKQIISAYE